MGVDRCPDLGPRPRGRAGAVPRVRALAAAQGEPVAYILGRKGVSAARAGRRPARAGPAARDRARGEAALGLPAGARVVDVGTGSRRDRPGAGGRAARPRVGRRSRARAHRPWRARTARLDCGGVPRGRPPRAGIGWSTRSSRTRRMCSPARGWRLSSPATSRRGALRRAGRIRGLAPPAPAVATRSWRSRWGMAGVRRGGAALGDEIEAVPRPGGHRAVVVGQPQGVTPSTSDLIAGGAVSVRPTPSTGSRPVERGRGRAAVGAKVNPLDKPAAVMFFDRAALSAVPELPRGRWR